MYFQNMPQAVKQFKLNADPVQCFERARESGEVLSHLQTSYQNMLALFAVDAPVTPREVSGFINIAESAAIVSREGMRASGFRYVMDEDAMRDLLSVTAAEVMPTVDHIMMQVNRACRILNRRPEAYNPAESPLYGQAVSGWTPFLP
ncbi:MAG: hypothetical protein JWO78_2510 [Micavibrio sp.]|nr:hypothetical protein [Micavibrio sp.]